MMSRHHFLQEPRSTVTLNFVAPHRGKKKVLSLHTLKRRVPVSYTPFRAKPTDKQANSMTIYISKKANIESRSLKPEGRERKRERDDSCIQKRRDRDLARCRASLRGKSVRGF